MINIAHLECFKWSSSSARLARLACNEVGVNDYSSRKKRFPYLECDVYHRTQEWDVPRKDVHHEIQELWNIMHLPTMTKSATHHPSQREPPNFEQCAKQYDIDTHYQSKHGPQGWYECSDDGLYAHL
jgi:hypothetical protein